MRNLIKELFILSVLVMTWYAFFWGIAFVLYPHPFETDSVDSKKAETSLFKYNVRYVLANLPGMMREDVPKVVILGSSNAVAGLRPNELVEYFPGYKIHNIGIGGATINDISYLVDAVIANSTGPLENTVFVVGIYYMEFVKKKRKLKNHVSQVYQEMRLYNLYEFNDYGISRKVGPEEMRCLVGFFRPYIIFQGILYSAKIAVYLFNDTWKQFVAVHFYRHPFLKRFFSMLGNWAQKSTLDEDCFLKHWEKNFIKPDWCISKKSLGLMVEMSDKISNAGAKLILVDLPISDRHKNRALYFEDYQTMKKPYLEQALALSGVWYMNMQDLSHDDTFSDFTHVKSGFSRPWADALGAFVETNGINAIKARKWMGG